MKGRLAMAKKKRWDWLLAPIRTETDATEVLTTIAKWWYGLAGLGAFLGIIFLLLRKVSIVFAADVGVFTLAGYFLPRRKSRTFSVFLFIFALLVAVETFKTRFGLQGGIGGNIILAVFAVLVGYRSIYATFVYHARVNSQTNWKNVLIVWSITIGATLLTFFLAVMGWFFLEQDGIYLSGEQMGNYLTVILSAVCAICFILLTKRFDFVTFPTTSNGE
jgi:hypothetical protein